MFSSRERTSELRQAPCDGVVFAGVQVDMQLTPTITFRHIRGTDLVEAAIRERLRKLETHAPRIVGCRVLMERVQRHHEAGNRYHVRLDFTVPGGAIAVSHEAGLFAAVKDADAEKLSKAAESDPQRKHALVAIREAFDIARRQLQDHVKRERGATKADRARRRPRASRRGVASKKS